MSVKLSALRTAFAVGSQLAPRRAVEFAARLFATPSMWGHVRGCGRPHARIRPNRTLAIGVNRIATYVWGDPDGQPYVLLAHGWSSCGLCYLPWVERLRAKGYALVAFDQPGHGRSSGSLCTIPDFVNTASAVGAYFGPAALAVGHALGAAAVVLAQGEGWRARELILIAPIADMIETTRRFARHIGLGEHLHEPLRVALMARMGLDPRVLQVHRRLHHLDQSGFIVHDRHDPYVPWAEGERYARFWRGARLFTTEGLGHDRLLSDGAVIDACMAFLHEVRSDTCREISESFI